MWDALERNGIEGNFLKVWKSLYGKLKSCVKVNGNLTQYFDCTIGTRQGYNGSTKLFSLFINDLIKYQELKLNPGMFVSTGLTDLLALMFADDISSFSDTVIGLQGLINEIEIFCKTVGVEINLDKTKIIVFRNGGPLKQVEKWFLDGKIIENVSFYKHLNVLYT